MMGNVTRSVFAAVAFYLLSLSGAVAATTIAFDVGSGVDDVDGELSLNTLTSPQVFFGPSPSHPASLTFTDYYYIDFDGSAPIIAQIGAGTLPPGDPADFSLDLFVADIGVTGDLTFDETSALAGPSSALLSTVLITGDYVLRVIYTSATNQVAQYSGQITATPLPPALLIFGTGLFGLGLLSRYRRKRQGQLGLQV